MSDAGEEKETADVAMEVEAPSDEEVAAAGDADADDVAMAVAPSAGAEAALLAVGSPPGASPPGMNLRSGKKKRRSTDHNNNHNKRIRSDSMSSTESSGVVVDPIATGTSAPTGRVSLAPIQETVEEPKAAPPPPEPMTSPEPGAAAATKFASAAALLASGARFARLQSPPDEALAQAQLASDTPEQQPKARRLVWHSSPPPVTSPTSQETTATATATKTTTTTTPTTAATTKPPASDTMQREEENTSTKTPTKESDVLLPAPPESAPSNGNTESFLRNVKNTVMTRISDQFTALFRPERLVDPNADDDGLDIVLESSTLWTNTWAWILLFGTLHLVLSGISVMDPVWNTIPSHSRATLDTYQTIFGMEPLPQQVPPPTNESSLATTFDNVEQEGEPALIQKEEEEVVVIVDEPDPSVVDRYVTFVKQTELAKTRQSELDAAKAELDAAKALVAEATEHMEGATHLETMAQHGAETIQIWRERLFGWEESLEAAETALASTDDVSAFQAAVDKLKESSLITIGDSETTLWNANAIPIPGQGCEGMMYTVLDEKEGAVEAVEAPIVDATQAIDPPLELAALETAKDDLFELVVSSTLDIMEKSDSTIRQRISEQLSAEIGELLEMDEEEEPTSGDESSQLSNEDAQAIIDEVLELEAAGDSTDLVDYASIPVGARVLHSKTSPSLVDGLPLLNQALAKTRLRFYGHDAEAALMPGSSLGQCWSFESLANRRKRQTKSLVEEDEVDMDVNLPKEVSGTYATLAISLAAPIHVTELAMEHAANSSLQDNNTSISEFRVYGYTDANAETRHFYLGAFRFDVGYLQPFPILPRNPPLPKFQSIVVAMDEASSHTNDYACLYRFRVHGDP